MIYFRQRQAWRLLSCNLRLLFDRFNFTAHKRDFIQVCVYGRNAFKHSNKIVFSDEVLRQMPHSIQSITSLPE
jgi:hypothetical protein